jgi:hypothetical protein
MGRRDPTEFTVIVKHQTDGALLCDFGDSEIWIPKSQLLDEDGEKLEDPDFSTGDEATIYIPEWLAEEKGVV